MTKFWSTKSETPNIYANFTGFNGIDCHIFRYEQGSSERAQKAAVWFEKNQNALSEGLK
jgi:hypothetical protein